MIVAIIVALFTTFNPQILEGFSGLSGMTTKVFSSNSGTPACSENMFCGSGPGFQSMLAPRMAGNFQRSANMVGRPAPQAMMAFDSANPLYPGGGQSVTNPMAFAKMATKEGYCTSGTCGSGAMNSLPRNPINKFQGPQNSQYRAIQRDLEEASPIPEATSTIPVGDMTGIDAVGIETQVKQYDTIVYANQQSRLRSRGDPIRGDLPIAPACGQKWFSVAPTPHIDLQPGALNVMGGFDNETSRAMAALQVQTSAGTKQALGGISLTDTNIANQFPQQLSQALSTIQVSSF
jgi:hypothetical protein